MQLYKFHQNSRPNFRDGKVNRHRSCTVTFILPYDTIRDVILTCARKPTRVSLIYRTEPTTKKCKTEKLKSKNGYKI